MRGVPRGAPEGKRSTGVRLSSLFAQAVGKQYIFGWRKFPPDCAENCVTRPVSPGAGFLLPAVVYRAATP